MYTQKANTIDISRSNNLTRNPPPAIDFVQEKFLGQGDQSNESAAEQAKDEAISDLIRDRYKTTTGKEFFIADKDKKFGL